MKNERHAKILELISKYDIDTQEMLLEKLREEGFVVTQATVSRDIKELNIVKTSMKNFGYKYAVKSVSEERPSAKYANILREAAQSVTSAMNLVIVKTYAGMADASAAAIDLMWHYDILGSIAGDDTIFVATSDVASAENLARKINEVLGHKN
ncbi:MAG: arginine repressor [Clostridia bacterium]|nr:arginine repressor [Clostridia bacterium]MBQ8742783.1 arginine repressor [Clostridia bacterium]MBQ9749086.1 arginine repressor [Clostridia bacterium]